MTEHDQPPAATEAEPIRTVVDNADARRWELREGEDLLGVVDYRSHEADGAVPASRDLLHVEVSPELRGQGVSAPFLDEVLDRERAAGRKVTPYCGYAAAHIRRHARHQDLLAT